MVHCPGLHQLLCPLIQIQWNDLQLREDFRACFPTAQDAYIHDVLQHFDDGGIGEVGSLSIEIAVVI